MVQATPLQTINEVCGEYRLKRLRGRGGFGSVWEAVSAAGETVALKFLPCEDSLIAAQEIRAIQVVSRLRHPYLVPIDRVWCVHRYVVVTMKLADGSLLDLLDVCREEFGSAVPAEHLLPMMQQAAQALDFLNTRQHLVEGVRVAIQHCDVKPGNLLLFGETVKLCDFGLASITTSTLKWHRRAGTLDYAAPEVFRGWLSDHTDQYSLAVTYYQLRTGELPFPKAAAFDPGYQRPAPDLSLVPAAEARVIGRALAPIPQERWPSCTELVNQLNRACTPTAQRPTRRN